MFNIRNPATGDPFKDDFRNFMLLGFRHLGLPDPTQTQLDFAFALQYGDRRGVFEAYRGFGKSLITSLFVCWLLLNDPDLSILVVSASKLRADDFTTFTLRLIMEMDILRHLTPKPDQRQSKVAFDVGPAVAKHSPSVKSVGITGQLAGSRADVIISDDVEVPNNSLTQAMRDKLWEAVKEYDAILKPGEYTRIIYLGTPQCEMSLYNELENRGYRITIWPARVPKAKQLERYGEKLGPHIQRLIDQGVPEWTPVDPERFDEEELRERELSYGRSGFALQFMLDTSLSDAERYPLRLSDLIVMDIDPERGPAKVVWGSGPDQIISDLPVVGMAGDRLHRPVFIDDNWVEYSGTVMTIDPSGRGKDEAGYAVAKMLHGYIYVPAVGGFAGGYSPETLEKLARIAKMHGVNKIVVESNFGDGMFTELFKPVLGRIYPCTIDEVHHTGMKEARIIDTLEPVMNQHRLVVDRKLVLNDSRTENTNYQLFYQMTRLSKNKGALANDDRVEALAMAVNYWVTAMAQDADLAVDEHKERLLEEELRRFMESATGGSFRKSRPKWVRT